MVSQFILFIFHFVVAKKLVNAEFEFKIFDFILPGMFLVFVCIIARVLMDFSLIRICLFGGIAVVLLMDVYERKAIF